MSFRAALLLLCLAGLSAAEGTYIAQGSVTVADVYLFPGDTVRVDVYDNNDLGQDLMVGRESTTFPLIGDIGSLAGMTPRQLQQVLTKRLADGYLREPVVTVSVKNFAPRQAAVLGGVRNPMRVDLPPFAGMTAIQAVAQAGGLVDEANRSQTVVVRRSTIGGPPLVIPIPPADSVEGATKDIPLRPGDVVVVPRLDRVYIMGEVTRPGPVSIDSAKGMTVARAISTAGGFGRFAAKTKVQLLREGKPVSVDVDSILNGKGGEDPVLQPGDVVFVPESLF